MGYEKNRYTLEDLNDNPLKTQLKRNNPNKPRQFKRFFASDFLLVNKKDIETNPTFTSKDVNKLNRIDNIHFINEKPVAVNNSPFNQPQEHSPFQSRFRFQSRNRYPKKE